MSLSASLGIAQGALSVNQSALNVVSNNIANMNTEGYSKQRVELKSLDGGIGIGQAGVKTSIGMGVDIEKITSYRQIYMDNSFRAENSEFKYIEVLYTNVSEIQTIMDELGQTGLSDVFSEFYSALHSLSLDPSNKVNRSNFIQKAQNVCEKFNSLATNLDNKRQSLVGDGLSNTKLNSSTAACTVTQINTKLEQLAQLNYSILKSQSKGSLSNSILDQRNTLIDDISSLIPTNVKYNENNTVSISLNGMKLVDGAQIKNSFKLSLGDENTPAIVNLVNSEEDISYENINDLLTSGSLGAIIDLGSSNPNDLTYSNILNEINKLANQFSKAINDIQSFNDGNTKAMAIGKDIDGNLILKDSTELIFEASDGSNIITAKNIRINQAIIDDPYEIAASRIDAKLSGDDLKQALKNVGNSDNIQAIIEIRENRNNELSGVSFEDYVGLIINKIGINSAKIESQYEAHKSTKEMVETQRQNTMGVNLDEELMDLIKYQRAYQASSRIFNTVCDMLDILVNLGK